jgi:predicted transcriptional regulator
MADSKIQSVFDTPPDEATEARLDAEAEADYAAGRVVPHERVRTWLMRLAKGEKVPPPEV